MRPLPHLQRQLFRIQTLRAQRIDHRHDVGEGPATECRDAADANDDGQIDVSDAVYLISYRFGAPNPSPARLV